MSEFAKDAFKKLVSDISADIARFPALTAQSNVFVSIASKHHIAGLSELYTQALNSGSWFATRYKHIQNFEPTAEFFEREIAGSNSIWFVFSTESGAVVGATKLELVRNIYISIDETQLNPRLGQGRGVMQNYFRRFIPFIENVGLFYFTEFVLTVESRSLRRVLISELGMVVTGFHFRRFESRNAGKVFSSLVACAPHEFIVKRLSEMSSQVEEKVMKDFLNFLIDNANRKTKMNGTSFPTLYSDMPLSVIKQVNGGVNISIDGERIPTAVDPFESTLYFDINFEEIVEDLHFLRRERIDSVTQLLEYFQKTS